MEARIEKLMDLVFELKQDVAALKEKSSSGTDPEPEPTTKTWTVTVTKADAEESKTIKYKLEGGEDQTVSTYELVKESEITTGFKFDITATEKPNVVSVTYDTESITSGITVTEKVDV